MAKIGRKKQPIETRFWSKVQKTDTCWFWIGTISDYGYGQLALDTRYVIQAHRLSWILENGPIADDLLVLHKCDIRHCVRSSHLFLGTPAINAADRQLKQRWKPKLSEQDVLAIRVDSRSRTELALIHNISEQAIWYIQTGRSWKHL